MAPYTLADQRLLASYGLDNDLSHNVGGWKKAGRKVYQEVRRGGMQNPGPDEVEPHLSLFIEGFYLFVIRRQIRYLDERVRKTLADAASRFILHHYWPDISGKTLPKP